MPSSRARAAFSLFDVSSVALRRTALTAILATATLGAGCSQHAEDIGKTSAAVDTICGEGATVSIDGIPAYAYCGNFDVYSNNGVDTRSYGGAGWVKTEGGYGYQCFELAARYMHFKWGVDATWGVVYASQMCDTHPAGVSVTTTPIHGDLAVFAGGSCGVAAPAGHVAVVDSVGASTFTAVQQNVAAELTWSKSCVSCFLHAAANTGAGSDPCSISTISGDNCGATSQFPGGDAGTLYTCSGGVTVKTTPCPYGCNVQPPGKSDFCNPPPPPPPPPEVWPSFVSTAAVDVNGDGWGDVCGRAIAGLECALGSPTGFARSITSSDYSNAKSWDHDEYGSTLQFADVNGDGKADVCGRNAAGIVCSLSTGTGFGPPIAGPAWSDAAGWNKPQFYGTIRFGDIDGDGKADVCGRSSAGITCARALGDGSFGAEIAGPAFSDANGFDQPQYYSVIQLADVNGDGKADLCGRDNAGILCALSDGHGFPTAVRGPAWSDGNGWNHPQYASTTRFVDVDGDGKADVCARAVAGIACALSTGDGFAPEFGGPAWSDAAGWNDASHYRTIQFADVNGDQKADVCGRSADGFSCALSNGSGFPGEIKGPAWSDANGFTQPQFYTTLGMADLDGDGVSDACVRTIAGMECAVSSGGAALSKIVSGPGWSDASGWGVLPFYASIRYAGAARPRVATADAGTGPTPGSDSGAPADPGAAPAGDDGPLTGSCSSSGRHTASYAWLLLGAALAACVRRRVVRP